jgi:hypothetical protein
VVRLGHEHLFFFQKVKGARWGRRFTHGQGKGLTAEGLAEARMPAADFFERLRLQKPAVVEAAFAAKDLAVAHQVAVAPGIKLFAAGGTLHGYFYPRNFLSLILITDSLL